MEGCQHAGDRRLRDHGLVVEELFEHGGAIDRHPERLEQHRVTFPRRWMTGHGIGIRLVEGHLLVRKLRLMLDRQLAHLAQAGELLIGNFKGERHLTGLRRRDQLAGIGIDLIEDPVQVRPPPGASL